MGSFKTFTFDALPENASEMKALKEKDATSDYWTAALSVLALLRHEADQQGCIEMLNVLKGPEPVSPYEKQFLRDRLSGKEYKPRSFFAGATPENGYEPSRPYSLTVSEVPNSHQEANYATLYLKSGGADSVRPVRLRRKPSTGEWFLTEIQYLSDIRVPASEDPWA